MRLSKITGTQLVVISQRRRAGSKPVTDISDDPASARRGSSNHIIYTLGWFTSLFSPAHTSGQYWPKNKLPAGILCPGSFAWLVCDAELSAWDRIQPGKSKPAPKRRITRSFDPKTNEIYDGLGCFWQYFRHEQLWSE